MKYHSFFPFFISSLAFSPMNLHCLIEIFFVYCSLQLLSLNDVQLQPDSCLHMPAKAYSSWLYSTDASFHTMTQLFHRTQHTRFHVFLSIHMGINANTHYIPPYSSVYWPLCRSDAFSTFHHSSAVLFSTCRWNPQQTRGLDRTNRLRLFNCLLSTNSQAAWPPQQLVH